MTNEKFKRMIQESKQPVSNPPDASVARYCVDALDNYRPLWFGSSNDDEFLAKTENVRKNGETIMELIARTGISRKQIAIWGQPHIRYFCYLAMEASADEWRPAPPRPFLIPFVPGEK